MSYLKPHQQRVVDEKAELSSKMHKLDSFISGALFLDLPLAEKHRLYRQMLIMRLYEQVLEERIDAFPKPEPSAQNDTHE